MDRLSERVEQELNAAVAAGREVTELELSEQLAAEFSAEYGQSEVRAVVISTIGRSMKHSPRAFARALRLGLWR